MAAVDGALRGAAAAVDALRESCWVRSAIVRSTVLASGCCCDVAVVVEGVVVIQ
jgi:hypothetical protein